MPMPHFPQDPTGSHNLTAALEECWMRFPDGTVKKVLRSRLLPLPTQLPKLNDWAVVVDP